MRSCVDEVCPACYGCRQADYGAIEGYDEDLWVRVEGLAYVKIAGDEGTEGLSICVFVWRNRSRDCYVGSSAGL